MSTETTRDVSKDNPLKRVASDLKSEAYLGDLSAVLALIQFNFQSFLEGIEKPGSDWESASRRTGLELAKIFLGKDSRFKSVPRWNEPGVIDEFLAKWQGLSETDPTVRLVHSWMQFLREQAEVMVHLAAGHVTDEQAKPEVAAITQRYCYLLIGVDPPTQAVLGVSSV